MSGARAFERRRIAQPGCYLQVRVAGATGSELRTVGGDGLEERAGEQRSEGDRTADHDDRGRWKVSGADGDIAERSHQRLLRLGGAAVDHRRRGDCGAPGGEEPERDG